MNGKFCFFKLNFMFAFEMLTRNLTLPNWICSPVKQGQAEQIVQIVLHFIRYAKTQPTHTSNDIRMDS